MDFTCPKNCQGNCKYPNLLFKHKIELSLEEQRKFPSKTGTPYAITLSLLSFEKLATPIKFAFGIKLL